MKKKKVQRRILAKGYEKFLNCSIDSLISKLKEYKKKCSNDGYSDLRICGTNYGMECDFDICIEGKRLETDKEYEERIKEDEINEKWKKENEKRDKELEETVRLNTSLEILARKHKEELKKILKTVKVKKKGEQIEIKIDKK